MENKIPNLPQTLIKSFYEYLQDNKIQTNLYEEVGTYIDTTKYSKYTKRVYKNRLRRYIRQNGDE